MAFSFDLLLVSAALLVGLTALPGARWRKPVCLMGAVGTGAYLAWRWHSVQVIDLAPPWQQWWVILSFVFEAVLVGEFWIFLLLSSRYRNRDGESERHARESRDGRALPRVDVFIATYNEPLAILEKTILGALAMDYPEFTVHVLDDGGRAWLAKFCGEVGVHYITRPDNLHKKAGNHNHALALTDAPLVAMFDADFVPFHDFLRCTVGFFEEDGVGIVQTPQSFYNKDSFQTNLGMQQTLLDDQRFFFNHVMPCRDAWGVAFYCGSSAVLRRRAIEAIGGIVSGLATEDQVTSVAMLAAGYRTVYVNRQLSHGLAPESTFALIEQRKRWCRGGIQLLFKHYGPLGPSMRKPFQRLFFLPTYWVLGYLSPIFYFVQCAACWATGYTPFVSVDPVEILLGTLAVFMVFSSVLVWVGRGTWLPILTPAFQLFLAFAVLPTAVGTLLKPWGKAPFAILDVTPKGALAQGARVNMTALVPLVTGVVVVVAAIVSSLFFPLVIRDNPGENLVLSVWTAVALSQIVLAIMVCFEKPYRRDEERFDLAVPVRLFAPGWRGEATTLDVSLSGARLECGPGPRPTEIDLMGLRMACRARRRLDDGWAIELCPTEAERRRLIVALFTGRRQRHDHPRQAVSQALGSALRRVLTD